MTTEKIPVQAHSSSAAPLAVNLVAVGLLLAQYLLGMAVNLFVAIPDHHPGAHAPDFFTNLAWAPRVGGKLYPAASTLAALAIIGAAFNGASFLDYSHQVSSMIIAGMWALALACYLTCLVASLRQQARTEPLTATETP
jgi:hypothetical protein